MPNQIIDIYFPPANLPAPTRVQAGFSAALSGWTILAAILWDGSLLSTIILSGMAGLFVAIWFYPPFYYWRTKYRGPGKLWCYAHDSRAEANRICVEESLLRQLFWRDKVTDCPVDFTPCSIGRRP